MKFYVLDLDVFGVGSWHTDKIEYEGRSSFGSVTLHDSAQMVAEKFARKQDGFDHDGAMAHIAVAHRADGSDAREYIVTLRIEERVETKYGNLDIPASSTDVRS